MQHLLVFLGKKRADRNCNRRNSRQRKGDGPLAASSGTFLIRGDHRNMLAEDRSGIA
jgi:hypothetical protein